MPHSPKAKALRRSPQVSAFCPAKTQSKSSVNTLESCQDVTGRKLAVCCGGTDPGTAGSEIFDQRHVKMHPAHSGVTRSAPKRLRATCGALISRERSPRQHQNALRNDRTGVLLGHIPDAECGGGTGEGGECIDSKAGEISL